MCINKHFSATLQCSTIRFDYSRVIFHGKSLSSLNTLLKREESEEVEGWGPGLLFTQNGSTKLKMNLDVGANGRITSPRIGPMDSVQVGKAVFVK